MNGWQLEQLFFARYAQKRWFEKLKMRHYNKILLIIVLIPAVLAFHKGVITVVVPTTPECLAG